MTEVRNANAMVEINDLKDPVLAEFLRGGNVSSSGVAVTRDTALKVAVAWRCVRIITGVMAALPMDVMIRVDERTRKPAVGNALRELLTVKPNRWQTPGEWKRMKEAHLLLRGNAYSFKRTLAGELRELLPLDPDRMEPKQGEDLSIDYVYSTKSGGKVTFKQDEILHIRGLSLDGVKGLDVISYAREALALSIQAEKVGAKVFKNGHFRSGVFQTDRALSDQAYNRLATDTKTKAGIDAEDAQTTQILEEGLKWEQPKMTAEQMQFLGIRSFERTDVGMFFGVPPFLYGDTEKSTSWGTGIEQQNIGFLQYTIQDWITTWVEALKRDCLAGEDPRLYVHIDANGFFKLDAATRREYFKAALGTGGAPGWMTPNEVREKEDMPPRPEKWADELPKQQLPKPGTGTGSNDNPPPA